MINMDGIPVIAGNMSELRGHAMMIAVAGTGYIDTGERVHNTWQDLRPHYIAPEAGQLMAATGPVATVCRHVGRNLQQARDALVVYADTVEAIQGELELLRTRATDVNAAAKAAGPEWRSDHDLVDRSNAVGDAITVQAAAFVDAQRACVNALRALHGQPALTADNGDGVIDPATEFGYTLDQFRAAAQADPDDGGGLPWGTVTERDYPWYLDVASAPLRFVGGLGDAVVNTALGVGALFGYDHATGQTTGATAGTAWTNLGKLVLAVGTYVGPGGLVRDRLGTMPFLEPGEAGQILTDTGKALIAYDQWDDDPARAAGNAVGNIALAVFGTKGAGAGLRGAGLALQLTRHGSLTARTGAVVTRAGDAIGRIPTLTDLTGNAWRRLHPPEAPRTPPLPDAPPAPRTSAPGETGTIGDDVSTGPLPPRTDRAVGDPSDVGRAADADATPAAGAGPGSGPDVGVRSPDGNRLPPDIDNGTRPTNAVAEDPPPRRSVDLDAGTAADIATPGPRSIDGTPLDADGSPTPDASGRPRNWEHLAQPTSTVSEPAIHAASVPARTAEVFLDNKFPQIAGTNLDRYRSGQLAYQQNCTHCVLTVDRQLDGQWAMAAPRPELGNSTRDMLDALPPARRSTHSSYDSVIRQMNAAGLEARAVVYIARPDGSAHVFNAVTTSDGVVFLDGQVGRLAELEPNVTNITLYMYRRP